MKAIKGLVLAAAMVVSSTVAASPLGDYYSARVDAEAKCSTDYFGGGTDTCEVPVYKSCPEVYFGDGTNKCVNTPLPVEDAVLERKTLEIHINNLRILDGHVLKYVRLQWNGEAFDIEEVK